LDLSSATDRFPVRLQERLIEEILGTKIANAWKNLLTNRLFMTPSGEQLKYSVGQPMGAYSS